MKRVAIVGAAGRMGQVMAEGLAREADFEVRALVDIAPPADAHGAIVATSLTDLEPSSVDVVVDFSTPQGVLASAAWCAAHRVGLVVGTTGLSDAQREMVAQAAASTRVVMAANFALGAVLAERFAVLAAPYFERVEVIELHHDAKVDAPSGTSLSTARSLAAARRAAGRADLAEPTQRHSVEGSRGADVDGVRVHAVRLPGLVAHEEILFGGPGEGLTIRHDSYDRRSFVQGVALALRKMGDAPGLSVGVGEFL
ncbi:MAG: 4-hydroxy-tetrahydrodipicolinate reductase [Acidobacteriota bacterium]|nr:4-hydroxy-tetrahydrodipicolinate reductase [Acidobacteriota bacterium]